MRRVNGWGEKLANDLKFRIENDMGISEVFLEKSSIVTHQVRMGWR